MATHKQLTFFATAPKYLSELLAEELIAFGAEVKATKVGGVQFSGDLICAYRACLWSRIANRILLPIATFAAPSPEALYVGIQSLSWSEHLGITDYFAVDFSSRDSAITHTQYGAQKVKDAIVDQFRENYGERPSVRLEKPDVMINVYVHRDVATVSIDLSGESLHKRGYRRGQGEAPLKENLAAAILLRTGWKSIAEQGGALIDLMCGVGTLPIEAALIAGNIAPGLGREYFGFLKWRKHQKDSWQQLVKEAHTSQRKITVPIVGYDADARVIRHGLDNIAAAGLQNIIHLEKRELANFKLNTALRDHPGLAIVNPPYGERLGEETALEYLYRNLGEVFKTHLVGWQGAVFTANPDLGKAMRLRASKYYSFYNGPIPCRLLLFDIDPTHFHRAKENKETAVAKLAMPKSYDSAIQMFVNRLEKNYKHLEKWAKRENISCYRVYDADLPEYAVAIDRYEDSLYVQEYAPPKTIAADKAEQRLKQILQVLPEVMSVSAKNVFCKTRRKQTRELQYTKFASEKKLQVIHEDGVKFLVNFTDYLDTGIFLDQRFVRQKIAAMVKGKHFLNLFAYTGTATIYAVKGGAASTTTVDMSATYLEWAKQNLALNGYSQQKHHFIQADCLAWLNDQRVKYDVIFVAPPVFSRSKRMEGVFDIERDHMELLLKVKNILPKHGQIVFATHKKNFQLAESLLSDFIIEDWKNTLPMDFQRSANSYFCWLLQRRN